MQALSLDIRERIIQRWQAGETKADIARRFMVSLSSVKRFVAQFVQEGHVKPRKQQRMKGKLTGRLLEYLKRQVEHYADYTLAQHQVLWNRRHKVKVSESCLSRNLRRMGITRKKKSLSAAERDEEARRIFREVMKELAVEDVVVVDESGTRIGMVPTYGRSWRGSRVYDTTIGHYGHNVSLVAALNIEGIQAAMTVDGAVDGAVFEAFVEKVLVPRLRPGQIVILDNLSSHKSSRVEALLQAAGCALLFLPAYSPDLSPIEEAFSKLKAFIRRCRCKKVWSLLRAIARGLDDITAQDARGWFTHTGFCVSR